MKKLYIAILAATYSWATAQVGIGTTSPNASAALDVYASDRGLLMPKVNLTSDSDVTTITSPATGLLVYNLTDANLGTPTEVKGKAIYSWDGAKWQKKTNLLEVRPLKVEDNFVLSSTAVNTLDVTASGLGTIGNVIPLEWGPTEVVVEDGDNIEITPTATTTPTIDIKNTAYYQVSGTLTFTGITTTAGAPSNFMVSIQRLPFGSSTWITLMSAATPLEQGTTGAGKYRTITFPVSAIPLNTNDKVRVVISRPVNTGEAFIANTAVKSRLIGSITKSFKFSRIN